MRKHSISKDEIDRIDGFLIGSKLGDGSFIQRTPKHNVYIVFKQSQNQYEYLLWKYSYVKNIANSKIKERNFTEGRKDTWQRQFYFSTISLKELIRYNKLTIKELLDEIDEIGFAVWLLDDGNCYEKGWKLSCGRFTKEEREYAIKIINEKFSIKSYPYEHPTKNKGYIRINSSEYDKIKKIILNNIPNDIDVVRYKLNCDSEMIHCNKK